MDMGIGYNLGIFFHVIGILLLFAALALYFQVSRSLKQADTKAKLKTIAQAMHRITPVIGIGSGLILLSGVYLSYLHISEGGEWGWLVVAIVVFVAMGVYGSMNGRRLEAKVAAAATGSAKLEPAAGSMGELVLSAAMFLSILILMIFQPGLLTSIIIVLVCLAAGAAGRRNPAA